MQAKAEIGLLIRKPVEEVFRAFVEPEILTRFWFNRASGPLRQGETVTWYWDDYEASSVVEVLEMRENELIRVDWDADTEQPSTVVWRFERRTGKGCYVKVNQSGGFGEEPSDVVRAVADSTGGFALVLAAAKAYLEHGIELNIVADRF